MRNSRARTGCLVAAVVVTLLCVALPCHGQVDPADFVTITPILAIYPFFQRYFIKGLTIGALKE